MTDCFLSYARADSEIAGALRTALEERGKSVSQDVSDILPAETWRARIEELIVAAEAVVCIVTSASAESAEVRWELDRARELGKRIVPIQIGDLGGRSVPEPVRALHWLRADDAKNSAAVTNLVRALEADIGWVRFHTRLLVQAEENARGSGPLLSGGGLLEAELWLAASAHKEPAPTDLQRTFVRRSRQAADTRKRRWIGALAAGLVVAVALAAWALWQQRRAQERTASALTAQGIRTLDSGDGHHALLLLGQAIDETPFRSSALAGRRLRAASLARQLPRLEAVVPFEGGVETAAFHPDGRRALLALEDELVLVSLFDGSVAARYPREQKAIARMAFDPTGERYLVQYSPTALEERAGSLEVRTIEDNYALVVLPGTDHPRRLHGSFIGGGSRLLITRGGRLALLDASDGAVVSELSPDARFLAASSDGHRFVTFSPDDMRFVVYDGATGGEVGSFANPPPGGLPTRAEMSPAGDFLFVTFRPFDGYGYEWSLLWDVATLTQLKTSFDPGAVSDVGFSPDGKRLFVRMWGRDLEVLTPGLRPVRLQGTAVLESPTVGFDGGGELLVVLAQEGTASVWNATSGARVATLHRDRLRPGSMAWSADRQSLLASDAVGIRLWRLPGGRSPRHDPVAGAGDTVVYAPHGRRFAVRVRGEPSFGSPPRAHGRVFEAQADEPPVALDGDLGAGAALAISSAGDLVLGAEGQLWDAASGRELRRLPLKGVAEQVAFDRDGKWAATVVRGLVEIWDVANSERRKSFGKSDSFLRWRISAVQDDREEGRFLIGSGFVLHEWPGSAEPAWTLNEPTAHLGPAAEFADGGRLAIVVEDEVRVYKRKGAGTARLDRVFDGGSWLSAVAWSGEGPWLAIGGTNGLVRIWDADTGLPITGFGGHRGALVYAAFNGSELTTAASDLMVRVWPVTSLPEPVSVSILAEALTGATLDANGSPISLAPSEWEDRHRLAQPFLSALLAPSRRRRRSVPTTDKKATPHNERPPSSLPTGPSEGRTGGAGEGEQSRAKILPLEKSPGPWTSSRGCPE